jgi:carbon storage regulator
VLVLTRKVGDVIAIGDNIKIIVMAIKGKQVRLGIQADKNTVVHREEIYLKIQQETKAAMTAGVSETKAAAEVFKTAHPVIIEGQPKKNNPVEK